MTICQVADELVEFVSSIDEIRIVNDLAKNERIFLGCHITLISVTLNGVIGKCPDRFGGMPIDVTPNGVTITRKPPLPSMWSARVKT